MSHMSWVLVAGVVVALSGGCSGQTTETPSPTPTDPPSSSPSPEPATSSAARETDPPPTQPPADSFLGFDFSGVTYEPNPFSLVVDTKVQLGTVGQIFNLSARMTGGVRDGSVDYTWLFPGSEDQIEIVSQQDEDISVRTNGAGSHRVRVIATDRAGDSSFAGVVLHTYEPLLDRLAVGDLNDDLEVDSADLELMQGFLSKTSLLPPGDQLEADFDRNHRVDGDDLALLQAQVERGERAPRYLSQTSSGPGGRLLAIHPSLIDPRGVATLSLATVEAGDSDPECEAQMALVPGAHDVLFSRGSPGYLRLTLPPDLVCLTSPQQVELKLTLTPPEGEVTEESLGQVEIQPLPPSSKEPGLLILEAIARVHLAMLEAEDGLEFYAEAVALPEEEKALMLGTWDTSLTLLDQIHGQFHVAFEDLDANTKDYWERFARVNNLEALVQHLQDLTSEAKRARLKLENSRAGSPPSTKLTPQQGEDLLALLCALEGLNNVNIDVLSVTVDIGELLSQVADFPVVRPIETGPVLDFLLGASVTVFASIDLGDTIGALIPAVGDEIKVDAEPVRLKVGESSTLTADLQVNFPPGSCDGDTETTTIVVDLSAAFESHVEDDTAGANQAFRFAEFKEEQLDDVFALLEEKVLEQVPGSLELTFDLGPLEEAICDAFPGGEMPVEVDFLQASCGAVVGDTWTCIEECRDQDVSLQGDKDVCGEPIPGEVSIFCEGEEIPEETDTPVETTDTPTTPEPPTPVQTQLVPPPFKPVSETATLEELPFPLPGTDPNRPVVTGVSAFNDVPNADPACPTSSDDNFFHTVCGASGEAFSTFIDFSSPSGDYGVATFFITAIPETTRLADEGVNSYWQVPTPKVITTGDPATAAFTNVPLTLEQGTPGTWRVTMSLALGGDTTSYDPDLVSDPVEFTLILLP